MKRKPLTIGLFGFGCVGEGLFQVLERTPTLHVSIKKICIKHPDKKRSITADIFTNAPENLLFDSEIDVIVELIDDAEAAFNIVVTALKQGKAVVTGNKKMLAEHFEEIVQLQKQTGCQVLYEAACCASIPLIRNLEEYYDNDLLGSLEGIINGSTNYILDRMSTNGISFTEALKEAQLAGFAESNPKLDIEGDDAKNKLLILVAHAFGKILEGNQIITLGITNISKSARVFAAEKGMIIKLLAKAGKDETGRLYAYVAPTFVPADSQFGKIRNEFNGVGLQSSFSDAQFFVGKGAGSLPTASAVLSDLSALSYSYRYEYRKLSDNTELVNERCFYVDIFLSGSIQIQKEIGLFRDIKVLYQDHDNSYLIGTISMFNLKLLQQQNPDGSIVFFDRHSKRIDTNKVDVALLEVSCET